MATLVSAPKPRWSVAAPPDPEVVRRLVGELHLPEPMCALLAVRGYGDPEAAKAFLRPRLDHLHPPELLTDAERAVTRIARAVEQGEKILVHGDYDVDGACGTALLTRWLRELGGRTVPFAPHRLRDGYDFGEAGLAAAAAAGATLVVTVDCGVTAGDAIARAASLGIDVIVTDHHRPGEQLPPAAAVVNPNREDCGYPEKGLCGTGVAFKLCQALARRFDRPDSELYAHLDLVALATVADLVPLTGENRVLTRFGLRVLERTRKPGLRALLRVTGLQNHRLDAGHAAFVLAPRINAVGRLANARTAVKLLLTDDDAEAEALAATLDAWNRSRQDEDRRTLDDALELLAGDFDAESHFGIVLASERWHPGVIGIVASRVVERVHRPTVLVALSGERGRGSARSIPGFHLYEALVACRRYLLRFGGHRYAAGMDVRRRELPAFREAFNREAAERLRGFDLRPEIAGDLEIILGDLTEDLHHYLHYMGPFGLGNPRPVFISRAVEVAVPPRVVGRGHLKLELAQDDRRMDAIGFRLADRLGMTAAAAGRAVDVVFHLHENRHRGARTLQAKLLDLQPPGRGPT
ncbi:MAG: single-stranded-DNA-specific exonuclease RecJ [Gemmatimonadetes bacterium]|nr:single-stranded-DNA-specific exonuclease RecJ [Gemmatimonadota bacterium]